ncbi:hypothetical protein, partial [Burkholderia gladioli]|uniref:hypothetical protein n=1 Tax=Burkholderia gladioli TaxID=28095 RepID=UPI001ABA8655
TRLIGRRDTLAGAVLGYLAVLMDLYRKMIVGWAIRESNYWILPPHLLPLFSNDGMLKEV